MVPSFQIMMITPNRYCLLSTIVRFQPFWNQITWYTVHLEEHDAGAAHPWQLGRRWVRNISAHIYIYVSTYSMYYTTSMMYI